jgi:glycosyltransferase involved in cell wall biosynthesis
LPAFQPTTLEYDVILDGSHLHALSRQYPDLPVLNRIGDLECKWKPPNSVVGTAFMKRTFPYARVVRTGVFDDIPPTIFDTPRTGDYIAFMGTDAHKGLIVAERTCEMIGASLRVGANISGDDKWRFLYNAIALLHPSTIDAAPRLPLEAAMVGTPSLCLNFDGCVEHIENTVSGFISEDPMQMADCLQMIIDTGFDHDAARVWVAKEHDYDTMIVMYERLLGGIAEGERWR